MRILPKAIITFLLLLSFSAYSQKDTGTTIQLRSGKFSPKKNINAESLGRFNKEVRKVNGKSFAVLQFKKIPTIIQQKELSDNGVQLLDFISGNAYAISFTRDIDFGLIQKMGASAVFELSAEQKMPPAMAKGIFPSWSIKTPGMVDIWISFPKTISFEEIKKLLQDRNFIINSSDYKTFNVIGLKIPKERINELASFPFVDYIEPAPHGDQPLNIESRTNSRTNILNASIASGGYNLKGEGVVIGVGDDTDPHYHIDFEGRIINRAATGHNYHGTHVTGIIGAGGIRMEEYRGYAPKSTIVSQYFSGIIKNSPVYVSDYNMVVTNNSYGDVTSDCNYMGYYDLQSRILDLQAISYPNLQHVFAAGNDGTLSCSPYLPGFRTVLSGYQSSKNVLTVGSTKKDKLISSFSSRGPVKDGRIKPEVTAVGSFVFSTVPWNIHGNQSGTSMASPAVAGGAGLLYQFYRQQNGGLDPKNGLIKAIICNGADDAGNPGPDFTYGFGSINLLRSINMLQNNHYFISSVSNSNNNTHTISVPANTSQLKVMLFWDDPAASIYATSTLVNDLDLEITPPSGPVVFPYILDTIPANVNNNAATGTDHMNNIEQIVINNPATNNYTITVKGFSVAQGPQEYFLVYDFVPSTTNLTYPLGGEAFNPGEIAKLEWDSYGDPAEMFTLEYSINNGSSWTTISSTIPANTRQYDWTVPNVQTDHALIRLKKNNTSQISTSLPFVILGIPVITVSPLQCEGYFAFQWTSVTGATDYEIFKLTGNEMASIGTTTQTNYTLSGLNKDSIYWVSVRARLNGFSGRRALAESRQPNSGTCTGIISDNDLKLDSIIAPISGRLFTSSSLTSTTQIKARIKNLDDANVTSFKMRYSLNAGVSWNEEIVNATVLPGATYTHTFATTADLSATGTYQLRVEVINLTGSDPVVENNTITDDIKQLANNALDLTTPFLDNMESALLQERLNPYIGLEGIDRYDFTNSESWGRVRTFVNSGIAYSGSKALTLDYDGNYSSGVTNFLSGTFNLSSYNSTNNDLRLDFQYKHHGQSFSSANPYDKVWIRGNDTQPWIEAYDLFANQGRLGQFKKTTSIELSDLLNANGQNFASSFQVRWGQYGHILTADNDGGEGYTFDDIRIYETIDDIQLVSIDTPILSSCGLSSTTPVKVTVYNASPSTKINIPVRLVVDGSVIATETIPGPLAPNGNIQYLFTATANLAAFGPHTVLVNVQYATDNFNENDTATVNLINSPVINTFPYIENFESGNGNWYSNGTGNPWEYGIPASPKINRAASGTKAWKTELTGNYNNNEVDYLNSPCYDISGMTNPTLSLNIALDLEDCGAFLCDGAYIEYSSDGKTWNRLGNTIGGTNWYNHDFGGGNKMWSIQDYTRWHVATTPLPTNISNLRLRIAISSDPFVNFEGIAIDDIHIYDNTMGIYDGPSLGSPVTQNITGGTNWIDFSSGGKLIVSIQPNNQNIGSTDAQVFINTSGVRNDSKQYYHDRNITIKPANRNLSDSALVRFYFLDNETENLINASGCSGCIKPFMAAELGVTKYDDPDISFENGNLNDDVQGSFSFLSADWNKKVPFDKGYYAEFRVKDFSEFWLNNGGVDKQTPLPVTLINFNAKKKNNKDVLVEWKTALEQNVNRFEIEVAKGNTDYQQNKFVKIGEQFSSGNSTNERNYNFTDAENNKNGVRFYRLKIVDNDNTFVYSPVKPVVFNDEIQWQVYPNPSKGVFSLIYQLNNAAVMNIKIYDGAGKLIKQLTQTGNGFIQKTIIDIQSAKYASGIYLIRMDSNDKKHDIRLIKQ